ncbi:hypothetical protein [Amycolatopsis orientalis]|nr:hypothetical protein [Amycolatopsis orientalis]
MPDEKVRLLIDHLGHALHRASDDRRVEAVSLADLGTTLTEAGHPVIVR